MPNEARSRKRFLGITLVLCVIAGAIAFMLYIARISPPLVVSFTSTSSPLTTAFPPIDIAAYNHKMIELANFGTTSWATGISATSSAWIATTSSIFSPIHSWPAPAPYPLPGAILPFSRIVAYYGNFYSAQMGILGQLPPDEMVQHLLLTTADWQAADPSTPVIPAIAYIAVVAQGSPGSDHAYRYRMPDSQIQKAIDLADRIHGLVFLDVQVGQSDLAAELPLLEKYLEQPNVHLAIDPEFSMKTDVAPGKQIGTMNAADVNFAANYLAKIVRTNNLAPKILVVHRFTNNMVTGVKNIQPLPEVQIVMNMDGWGTPERKVGTYNQVVTASPVQFAGIKLFYKNDTLPPSSGLLTFKQVLSLKPQPIFIEYQ